MKTKINWNNFPTGSYFKGKIHGIKAKGRIFNAKGNIYLLQNVRNGSLAPNLLGYQNSWNIQRGSDDDLKINCVTELTVEVDNDFDIQKFKQLVEFVERIDILGYSIDINKKTIAQIVLNPFANCQNLSIKDAVAVLSNDDDTLEKIFKELSSLKAFSVIDIRSEICHFLPENKDLFLFKTRYESTNGSIMYMIGIDNEKASRYYAERKLKKVI